MDGAILVGDNRNTSAWMCHATDLKSHLKRWSNIN